MSDRSQPRAPRAPRAPLIIAIVGPTAAGKSAFGVHLAEKIDSEVISADSMQVYRGFDIGTGKVKKEEMRGVRHHLLDIVDGHDRYSAARFVHDADRVIQNYDRSDQIVIVGGTGLYVRALLHGLFETPPMDRALRAKLAKRRDDEGQDVLYQELKDLDPETAQGINPNDFFRISRALEIFYLTNEIPSKLRNAHRFKGWRYPALLIGLRVDKDKLKERIHRRVDKMMEDGWLDEVKGLVEKGYRHTHPMGALGYKQLASHLEGEYSLDDAVMRTKAATARFARRQRNWFSQEEGVVFVESFEDLESLPLDNLMEDAKKRHEQTLKIV